MSLDKLVAQIEEDANREIDRIIGEAKAEVEKKIKEAEKEYNALTQELVTGEAAPPTTAG